MISTVSVYKTDVTSRSDSKRILDRIRIQFPDSSASFDLEDCDHVLRIEFGAGEIPDTALREILGFYGYSMEVLP